jgi:hypothetical protein
MQMWLFFTIFGAVIFVPSACLFLFLQHLKKTILVAIKYNGTIKKIIIDDKILAKGKIEYIGKKKIVPIKIFQNEIRYGSFRRWIIKDLEINPIINNDKVSDAEIESYLNSETIQSLLLFGKTKQLLILLLGIIIFSVIVSGAINGYLTNSKICELRPSNMTLQTIEIGVKNGLFTKAPVTNNMGVYINGSIG